jgi:hypothetical protein
LLLVLFIGQSCATNKQKITCKKKKSKCSKVEKQKASKRTKKARTNTTSTNLFNPLIQDNADKLFELQARINYLEERLDTYQVEATASTQPDLGYTKKIILGNGTVLMGNITYQDDYVIQIETMIGTLSLDKSSIIRVVDQEISVIDQEMSMIDLNMLNNSGTALDKSPMYTNSAQVMLLGDFMESKDANNNTILSGEVKNVGSKRADFAKVTFTIYRDKSHNSSKKEYTTFISGSTVNFDMDTASHSSLYSNETGNFSVVIPSDFGPFFSYSYSIDWEEYE